MEGRQIAIADMHGGPRVVSIHVGKVAPQGPEGVPSAFVKRPVQEPVNVTPLSLESDMPRGCRRMNYAARTDGLKSLTVIPTIVGILV